MLVLHPWISTVATRHTNIGVLRGAENVFHAATTTTSFLIKNCNLIFKVIGNQHV